MANSKNSMTEQVGDNIPFGLLSERQRQQTEQFGRAVWGYRYRTDDQGNITGRRLVNLLNNEMNEHDFKPQS